MFEGLVDHLMRETPVSVMWRASRAELSAHPMLEKARPDRTSTARPVVAGARWPIFMTYPGSDHAPRPHRPQALCPGAKDGSPLTDFGLAHRCGGKRTTRSISSRRQSDSANGERKVFLLRWCAYAFAFSRASSAFFDRRRRLRHCTRAVMSPHASAAEMFQPFRTMQCSRVDVRGVRSRDGPRAASVIRWRWMRTQLFRGVDRDDELAELCVQLRPPHTRPL